MNDPEVDQLIRQANQLAGKIDFASLLPQDIISQAKAFSDDPSPGARPPYSDEKTAKKLQRWLLEWKQNDYKDAFIQSAPQGIKARSLLQKLTNAIRYCREFKVGDLEILDHVVLSYTNDGIIVRYGNTTDEELVASTVWGAGVPTQDSPPIPSSYSVVTDFLQRLQSGEEEIDMPNLLLTDEEVKKFQALRPKFPQHSIILTRNRVRAYVLADMEEQL